MSESMEMYVIYEHPEDFPDEYICRRWGYQGQDEFVPGEIVGRAATLEECRASLPDIGLVRLNRDVTDAPTIVESWI